MSGLARTLLTILIAVVATVALAGPAAAQRAHTADRDCSDFSSQAEAQRYFESRGPGDPDRLDGSDGDGRACESLPCPCARRGGSRPRPRPRRPDFAARVVRVIDGDTIAVRSRGGRTYRVRLIGIDTPEVFGGRECGGTEASASMKSLARPGGRVRVYGDPSQDRTDRFGRLLAYVKLRGGAQLNLAQVARGWAKVYVFGGHPFDQTATFRRAAARARAAERGVWGRCGGDFHRPAG